MVKDPPGNAKDTSCSLGPGRSHMLQSDSAHAPGAHAPQQEKSPPSEARTPNEEQCNPRRPACSNEDPTQPKITESIKE